MKTYLKSLSTLFLLLGLFTQTAFCQKLQQNNNRIDEAAKIQVDQLTQTLNLNGTQQRALFRVLVTEANRSGQSPMKVLTQASEQDEQAITNKIKSLLTPEQFLKWRDPRKK